MAGHLAGHRGREGAVAPNRLGILEPALCAPGTTPSHLLGRLGRAAVRSLAARLVLVSSTLRPSERISLTSTLKLSGMPDSKVSSPRTMAS